MAKFENVDTDIPNEIAPGLKARQSIGCQKITYVLSFDGKKLAPGLNKEGRDQDCLEMKR